MCLKVWTFPDDRCNVCSGRQLTVVAGVPWFLHAIIPCSSTTPRLFLRQDVPGDPQLTLVYERLRLPRRYHDILSLRLQLFRPSEIAEATGLTRSTVRRYLHEIRVRFGVVGESDRALLETITHSARCLAILPGGDQDRAA